MSAELIFYSVFFFDLAMYFFDEYLCYRQRTIYRSSLTVPADLKTIFDKETFGKSRLYALDKSNFGVLHGLYSQVLSCVVLLFGLIPVFWNFSAVILQNLIGVEKPEEHQILMSMVFLVVQMLLSNVLDQPWSIYSTFVIEERHGFNKQTRWFYFKDQVKKFAVTLVLALPILALLLYIIEIGGDYFFLYAWTFVSVVTFALTFIFADFIMPLFDKYTPLPEGELRSRIEELAASVGFPLYKLYVVEGSKRSAHSNAFFYGFWKNKRIVLFDTLLEDNPLVEKDEPAAVDDEGKRDGAEGADADGGSEENEKKRPKIGCDNDEVLAVLAHELGHWKLSHNLLNILIAQANLFLCFAVFQLLIDKQLLYAAFGFDDSRPVFIGLIIIFQFIFAPYHQIIGFAMICLTRRFEFAADAFAAELGKTRLLRRALVKLNNDNLSFPIADWLYSTFKFSHPPILERLRALEDYEKKER